MTRVRLGKGKAPPRVSLGFKIDGQFNDLGEMTVELAERYGDMVRIAQFHRWYFINHPDYIRRVLLTNQANYTKINVGFKRISALFGKGLLTVTDPGAWQRQHDLVKKLFQKKQLVQLAGITNQLLDAFIDELKLLADQQRVFNLSAELMALVFRSSSLALFAKEFDQATAQQVIQDLELCNRYVSYGLAPNLILPTFGNLQYQLARKRLRNVVRQIIAEFEQLDEQPENLLSVLLSGLYRDPAMSRQELEDQVFTFMVTGHETTGSLLSWVLLCLHLHPEVKTKLRADLHESLQGNLLAFEQLDQFDYLRMVIEETLRLYPSIWHIVRRATDADQLGDYRIAAGSSVLISQYALHRHPEFWPEPSRFKPERFAKGVSQMRLSYLPFGFGPRTCIAASMAMLQAKLITAGLIQQFDFNIFDSQHVNKEFLISMRPKDGLRATVSRCVF